MAISYKEDFFAWANEQARFIREGNFLSVDVENLSEEIEAVGRSEKRELASRMKILIAHLIKWKYQHDRRCTSWEITIMNQKEEIQAVLKDSPSLKLKMYDDEWFSYVYHRGLELARNETGIDVLPEACPWTIEQIISKDWLPD